MAVGIGAGGLVGIAFEVTAGTYVAPTKFFPIRNETLTAQHAKMQLREIRGVADVTAMVKGDAQVGGDLTMAVRPDVLPYFLHASRGAVVKSGAGPYTYEHTPGHGALPTTARTLSITIVRSGVVFAYAGCVVGVSEYSLDEGLYVVRHAVVGRTEASQPTPTPTFANQAVFGKGMYVVQIPTATPVCDVDTFTLTIDDGAVAEFRLCGDEYAEFIRFGERSVGLSLGRDFDGRTDYDNFKAATAQSITLKASNGASADVAHLIPVAIKDTYELGLSGQGDLVRAQIQYVGIYDATVTSSMRTTVITTENIT